MPQNLGTYGTMKILIAEDEPTQQLMLKSFLEKWGYEVVVTDDGAQAWAALQEEGAPSLAILDWMMPEMDGVEVCRKVRQDPALRHLYLIMLTALDETEDIVQALETGADDYVSKPPIYRILRARVQVGARVVELQTQLAQRVRQLEAALSREKQLQGLLPICSYCKKIRDDTNYWQQVEEYIGQYADVSFSHSICPQCYTEEIEPQLAQFKADLKKRDSDPE